MTNIYSGGVAMKTKVAAVNPVTGKLEEKQVAWFKTSFSRCGLVFLGLLVSFVSGVCLFALPLVALLLPHTSSQVLLVPLRSLLQAYLLGQRRFVPGQRDQPLGDQVRRCRCVSVQLQAWGLNPLHRLP